MREPHVRVHVGERALTAWLVLDTSASMTFGTADRRKADVAEGVAIAIGHVASRRGNRLGVVAFGGGEPKLLRPRQGRIGLLGCSPSCAASPRRTARARPRSATRARGSPPSRAPAGWWVLVSDFRGERDWEGQLRALRARHGVLAVEIRDPREQELTPMGDLWLVDPETGRQLQVNTSGRRVRRRFAEAAAAEREEVAAALRRAGAEHLVLSTGGDWLRDLAGHLRRSEAALRPPAGGGGRPRPPGRGRRAGGMTFREPVMLAGLLLIPLAALAYLSMQRRRRREAATFANPALLPNLVTARPGWRRHLPPLLILLALATLVIALARPQRTVAAPQRAATVMMVTDISGSMNANDVEPDRLTAAVEAAHRLTDELPETFRLGIVTFADFAEVQAPPTTDRSPVRAALDRLRAEGGTAMALGLERALALARRRCRTSAGPARAGCRRCWSCCPTARTPRARSPRSRSPARRSRPAFPSSRSRSARRAARSRCATSSAACSGSRCRPTPRRCARSRASPAAATSAAPDAARLESIYANLGTRLSSRPVEREVTAAFAGGAVVLLLAGGALSLAWFGRLL